MLQGSYCEMTASARQATALPKQHPPHAYTCSEVARVHEQLTLRMRVPSENVCTLKPMSSLPVQMRW